jgi:urease accessory protein
MSELLAQDVCRKGDWADASWDRCALTYDARFLRRRVLTTLGGVAVLVDLPKTTSLDHGDALQLSDGRLIEITAKAEELLEVRGDDLPRLAWHIGNRHTPCQIEPARLLIQRDHVIAKMLGVLAAEVREVTEPFTPEGGAYGHGRTHSHEHRHQHAHSHEH